MRCAGSTRHAPRPISTRSSPRSRRAGAEVLLAGMFAPRNLGEEYTRAFDGIYPELGQEARADPLSVLSRRRRAGRRSSTSATACIPTPRVSPRSRRGFCPRSSTYRARARTAARGHERLGHAAAVHGARNPASRPDAAFAHAGAAARRQLDRRREHAHHSALCRRHRRAHGRRSGRSAGRHARAPFPVSIVRRGRFGGRDPRVLWAGVDAEPELEALYRANERAARAAGLEPDPRGFKPHVTLARMRGVRPSSGGAVSGGVWRSARGAVHGHALRAAVGAAGIGRAAIWHRGRVSVPGCGCGRSGSERA